MISILEINSLAKDLQLLPTTVEKDYVLSWVLYGISQNPHLSEWFFKGVKIIIYSYFSFIRMVSV